MLSRTNFRPSLDLACALTGMSVALISEVSQSRWWAIQAIDRAGLGITTGLELDINLTFCRDVRTTRAPVWFGDCEQHLAFKNSPIPPRYGFRSYISVPLVLADGAVYGTLCTLDPAPRDVTLDMVQSVETLARLVAAQIDAARVHTQDLDASAAARKSNDATQGQLADSEQALVDLRLVGKQREEFIAVLAHDLRNPLQAIAVSADLLSLGSLTAVQKNLVGHVESSVARIAELIDVTLDFARGRLGSGIALRLEPWADLGSTLAAACREAVAPYPGRPLEIDVTLPQVYRCDGARLCQLVGNLVINAAIHGTPDKAIQVTGHATADGIELSVSNEGIIPPESMTGLFEPFVRAPERHLDSGLGLGLYIASQIAKAHGGTLVASSDARRGTVFTLRL